jgi:hypothetical protein
MEFTDKIDLGNIMTMFTVFGSVIAAGYSLLSRLNGVQHSVEAVGKRLDRVDLELHKQTDILVELAKTRERMNHLDRRIDEVMSRLNKGA